MNEGGALLKRIFMTPVTVGGLELPFSLLTLLLELILPLAVMVLLYRLLIALSRRIIEPMNLREETKAAVKKWVRRVLRGLYLLGVAVLIGRLLGAKIFDYLRAFFGALNQPLVQSGNTNITFITIFLAIPVFYVASWAGKASKQLIRRSMLKRVGLDEAQQFSLINLVRYTVMVLVLLVGLSIIGINLSALTVIFGVLGIGLGFGLQNLVANFFSGLVIIITRPVKEGDRILVNGLEGDIIQIRMVSTVINTLTNESIIIPNSHLVSESVHNYSFNDTSIVVRNDIGVAYASDVDRVITLLSEVAGRNPYRLEGKEPIVRFKEFGDSSLNFAVFTWIRKTVDKYNSHHWMNVEIWRALKQEGVEIPFPQQDVYIRAGTAAAEGYAQRSTSSPNTAAGEHRATGTAQSAPYSGEESDSSDGE